MESTCGDSHNRARGYVRSAVPYPRNVPRRAWVAATLDIISKPKIYVLVAKSPKAAMLWPHHCVMHPCA